MMDYTIFRRRREELGSSLPDQSVLFLFSGQPKQKSMDLDFPFAPDRNFYYLTGLTEPGYILLMTKLHGKLSQQLFLSLIHI